MKLIRIPRKILITVSLILTALGAEARPIRIVIDQPPATLNPRHSLDAPGQRLGNLLFSALTHINENLEVEGDLATHWISSADGKVWSFYFRPLVQDHEGLPITPAAFAECVEQYIHGKPKSGVGARFEHIAQIQPSKDVLKITLSRSDPYLPKDLTLIRFFRSFPSKKICDEGNENAFIGSGRFRLKKPSFDLQTKATFISVIHPEQEFEFEVVRDDNTRTLKMIRGDSDVSQNGIQFTKLRWLEKAFPGQFSFLERDSTTVSYLAFNVKDPVLQKVQVRRAIALAIDRANFVSQKMMAFGSVANSLVSPILSESSEMPFEFDPKKAEKLLEEAGFSKDEKGIRIRLHFKTTPAREGYETALIFKEMLKKIGIEIELDIIEPAVFLSSIRKGKFQLYQSRWVGVGDASILYRTLHSHEPLNRTGYENPEMDKLLDQVMKTVDLPRRKALYAQVQKRAFEDLPYFPLWFWKTSLVVTRRLHIPFTANQLSLSGALDPLTQIR